MINREELKKAITSVRLERLKKAIAYLISTVRVSQKSTQKDIAEQMGYNNQVTISNALNGNVKYLTESFLKRFCNTYNIFNIEWLLTGEKEMLVDFSPTQRCILSQEESIPNDVNYKLVPVIHVDSVGGVHSRNDIVSEPQFVEGYVPFVNAQDDDRAIYQSGNSMIPTIPPGSLFQLERVFRVWEHIRN